MKRRTDATIASVLFGIGFTNRHQYFSPGRSPDFLDGCSRSTLRYRNPSWLGSGFPPNGADSLATGLGPVYCQSAQPGVDHATTWSPTDSRLPTSHRRGLLEVCPSIASTGASIGSGGEVVDSANAFPLIGRFLSKLPLLVF